MKYELGVLIVQKNTYHYDEKGMRHLAKLWQFRMGDDTDIIYLTDDSFDELYNEFCDFLYKKAQEIAAKHNIPCVKLI